MPMQMPNQMPMQMNNQMPMQMNNQQMPMQMNNQQMPMQMNNQMPMQMPMQNPQPNSGMTLQEQLNAAFRKKQLLAAGGESQPSTVQQSAPFQPQPQPNFNQTANPNFNQTGQMNQTPQTNFMQSAPREDSQFRKSLQALQESQPQQQNNPSQEDNPAQSKANLKARLEQTLAANMGRSFNPAPTMSDRTQTQIDPVGMSRPGPEQQQQTLAPPPRVSLKNSKTIDVSQLENKYKPKKKKKGDGLFDDIENNSEDSGSEKDIFKGGEKKRNTKFDDLLTKPIIIVPDPPEEKPKKEIPVVKELGNTLEPMSQFNAKKIEDSFMVTKSNDVFKNKEDLLEKSKVQEVNKKDKFTSLFANDSDEEDDLKKTQDMNKLYAQEKLKRSATTIAPTSKNPNPTNAKVTSLFKDNDSDEDDKGFMAPKQVAKPILKEKKVIEDDEGLAPPVKHKLEKKASVRFNLDDDDEGKNKEKSDEKQKKNALFDEDEPPKPKFEEPKKPIFNPLENRPSKKNEETVNPLAKKSPIFNDESSENFSMPQKVANVEGSTKKSSALNFLDEPSEALDLKKKPTEIREEPKPVNQNPLRPSQKQIESNENPSKKLFDFDEPTESLGFQKTNKPFEEPTEKKQLPVSNERPSQKKPLDFDEPSESLTFQKAKPIEKPKEQVIFAAERPSNRNPLAFLDESSEALANEKSKLPEKPQKEQKPASDFEKPQTNTDIFGERPSKQPLQPEVKPQKDIFGGERPSNKKALDFLDESSEALTYNKAKSEIPELGLKKDVDPEPAFKSKTLKLDEPQVQTKKSVEPKFESNPLARPSEKKDTFDPLSRPSEKKDIFDAGRPSQKKDLFPPTDNTAKDRPSQLKTDGDNDLPAKRSAKTVTSKIAGLQDKLGNLPIGGMFQKPDDRVMLNLRRKKEEDRRPELDHDLSLDKPTMARKKKPRGQKNADFGESENDKNLNFERTNNAIVVHPEQNEIPEQRESQQNLDSNVSRNSKQKMMFEEEKSSDIFSKPQTKQQPLPNLDDFSYGKKQQPLPNLEDFASTKKQPKQSLDEMDDFLSRPSKQNKSIPPPSIPKTENPPVKKPLKSLLDDSDELPNPPNYKSQQSKQDKQLPKLPDISDDRVDRPSERKPKEKVSQEIFAESTSSKQQLPPALPSLSDDKPKKKKNPLDRPSEKEKPPVLEEKKSKKQDIFDEEDVPTKPSIKSKNNFDVPPIPGKVESKSVLPDFKAPTFVAKPGEKESKKLKKLFDDDDDDGDSLFKSSKPAFGNTGGAIGKKKNLFD